MPVDLMVMQRSCSSWRVSVRRASPAFSWAMIPAAATRESVRVDLPCYVERAMGRVGVSHSLSPRRVDNKIGTCYLGGRSRSALEGAKEPIGSAGGGRREERGVGRAEGVGADLDARRWARGRADARRASFHGHDRRRTARPARAFSARDHDPNPPGVPADRFSRKSVVRRRLGAGRERT